jgi:ATP-binding cassette subfamily F protein uup
VDPSTGPGRPRLRADDRVLDSVESVRRVTTTATGEITASSMLERFGFTGDRLTARIGDLSGGERRRLQLLRLLLSEPNVLLLDEPTNDLDIETLTVLEDFLDGWPGTLVVVSHDRYFLERVTDSTWALLGDGQISMLPRGVEEYLERRAAALRATPSRTAPSAEARGTAAPDPLEARGSAARPVPGASPGRQREARKTVGRVERQLAKLADREAALHAEMLEHAADYERLAAADVHLRELAARREALEQEWLEATDVLE